jgi:hypothetical protein
VVPAAQPRVARNHFGGAAITGNYCSGTAANLPAKTKEGGCQLSNGPRHAGTQAGFPKSATANYGLAAKPENLKELNRFLAHLKRKAYSASSVKTYRNEFLQLLQLLQQKPLNELTPDDLRRYML